MTCLKVYWWSPGHKENAGDFVTVPVMESLGHTIEKAAPSEADFIGSGSILTRIADKFRGVVVGSGTLDGRRLPLRADIRVVRGPLTARALDVWAPHADFGLLATLLLPERPKVKHDRGWLPHWNDKRERDGHRIDITDPPEKVLRGIASCRRIETSSLHGLIFADALQVPSKWILNIPRDIHKFTDYAEGMHMFLPQDKYRCAPEKTVLDKQALLLEAVQDI